ncbi:hypothetical protein KJZ63_05325 [Patescibacteria group bacterium]|nr:hypothetical protein [Patescibacteria group bacterium]
MKNRFTKSLLIAFLLVLLAAPQVFAMEIVVDKQGTVHFYESRVLGDDDGQKGKKDSKDEKSREDNEVKTEQKNERKLEKEAKKTEVKTEIRTISPYQKKQFEFKQEDNGRYKIEIQDGKEKIKLRNTTEDKKPESLETDSVDLSLPIKTDDKKLKERQLEQIKSRLEKSSADESLTEEEKANKIKEKQEELAKYQEKIIEARKERQAEQIKLKSVEGDEGGFELESNAAKAKLKGADFNYDQESGLVSIVTPSGQEHTLTHLPDEAIARMSVQGFFVDSNQEVEIETTNDTNVQYAVPSKKNKKLFGIFNRQVDSKVVLDDLTGEVTETEVPTNSFWTNLLNRFSY